MLTLVLCLYTRRPQHLNAFTTSVEGSTSTHFPNTVFPRHKYAYCAFLAPREIVPGIGNEEDKYLTAIRILIYHTMHDSTTRGAGEIPFIVMLTAETDEPTRSQLIEDGATIVDVDPITIDWIKPGRPRWKHVMTKLHMFKLTAYEKVLFLDSDTGIFGPLDGVFNDPATELQTNRLDANMRFGNDSGQPNTYMMAGNSGPARNEMKWPERGIRKGEPINAGFVIFKPSLQMFEYQYHLANIEGIFDGDAPEQNLFNYVYRRDGNMPWQQIDALWSVNNPIHDDLLHGVRSVHEKYWRNMNDWRLKEKLIANRWKMEGYLLARQDCLRGTIKS